MHRFSAPTRLKFWLVCLLLLVLGQGRWLCADVIVLKNGNRLEGNIVRESDNEVVIEVAFGKLSLAKREIAKIYRQSSTENIVAQGERLLALGAVEHGLAYFEKMVAQYPQDNSLRQATARAYLFAATRYLKNTQIAQARYAAEMAEKYGDQANTVAIWQQVAKYENWACSRRLEADRLFKAREYRKALSIYLSVLEVMPQTESEILPQLSQAAVAEGDRTYQLRQFDQALEHYNLALKINPDLFFYLEERWLSATINIIQEQYFAKEQWDEADGALQTLLKASPTCLPALFLSGVVCEQRNQKYAAFEFYQRVLRQNQTWSGDLKELQDVREQAQKTAGSVLVDRVFEKLPDDDESASGNWTTLATEHFQIFHQNDALANRVGESLEQFWQRILKELAPPDFNGTWPKRCEVYIYPSKKEYAAKTGTKSWAEGVTHIRFQQGRLQQQTIHIYQGAPLLLVSILPHELTHAMTPWFMNYQRDVPLWLGEGIAMLSEPAFHQNHRLRLITAQSRSNRLLPLATLVKLAAYPQDKDQAELFYAQSYSLVDFLVQTYGIDKLWRFGHQFSTTSVATAFQNVYGLASIDELEREWRKTVGVR